MGLDQFIHFGPTMNVVKTKSAMIWLIQTKSLDYDWTLKGKLLILWIQ